MVKTWLFLWHTAFKITRIMTTNIQDVPGFRFWSIYIVISSHVRKFCHHLLDCISHLIYPINSFSFSICLWNISGALWSIQNWVREFWLEFHLGKFVRDIKILKHYQIIKTLSNKIIGHWNNTYSTKERDKRFLR